MSVVIPAHNAALFIGDALDSVFRQSYQPIECVVVDDGSTDATAEVVARFPHAVLVSHAGTKGVSEARNAGVRATTGPLIAFLDADDSWATDKLRRQVSAISGRPHVGIVLTGYQYVDATMRRTLGVVRGDGSWRRIVAWLGLEGNGPAFSSTALVRREAFDAVEGFSDDLAICEDVYFVLRVARLFEIDALPESLAYYRVHGSQTHRNIVVQAENRRHMYALLGGRLTPKIARRCESNLAAHVAYKLVLSGHARAALPWLRDAARRDSRSLVRVPVAVIRRRVTRTAPVVISRVLGRGRDRR